MQVGFVYMVVTADKYELPVMVCDSLAELVSMSGFNIDSIKSAILRGSVIDNKYKIYRVDIREPEEKFNEKEYKKFCQFFNLAEQNFKSIQLFREYCFKEDCLIIP